MPQVSQAPQRVYDGDTAFIVGMNSLSQGTNLPSSAYVFGWNLTNRSGVLRSRPGFNTRYDLPDGNLQGFTTFIPRVGFPQHIAVVDGQVYVSSYPYNSFTAVTGATMSSDAKQVYFCQATQTVKYNTDGSLTLIDPRNLLMIQDGINPPAYYDGQSVTAVTGPLGTEQGTVMCWDGFRLWVARDEKVFASDISNPLSFAEQQFNTLGGLSYFILPGKVTAMGMTGGTQVPQLLVFTDSTCTTFQSNITTRSQWSTTYLFQRVILPGVGCVSQRSLVPRGGELTWYSRNGIAHLDSAMMTMESVEIKYLDAEMMRSKSRLSEDLSGIAAATKDNFLLVSVPHESLYNTHTWVNDASPEAVENGEAPQTWCSVWTGVRPVEWSEVVADGQSRLFCASADLDGHNRVYEAFQEAGQDNGVDIPWGVELRPYNGQSPFPKNFIWAELDLIDILGQFDISVSYAGASRGRWKQILVTSFNAARGGLDATVVYDMDSILYSLRPQSRFPRTQEVTDLKEDCLSSCNNEVEFKENIDSAFQLRIDCSGRGAIKQVRAAMQVQPDHITRRVPKPETEPVYSRFDGADSKTLSDLDAAPPIFTSSQIVVERYGTLYQASLGTAVSVISQSDADKRASQTAESAVQNSIRNISKKYLGSSKVS